VAGDDDVESGLRFLHMVSMQGRADLQENRATLYALLEELVEAGVLDLAKLESRREVARVLENERVERLWRVRLSDDSDKYAPRPLPDIDCRALLPLCKARCCKMVFTLSAQDLDERVVKWDYGRPYLIKQSEGRCVHQDAAGGCGVYEQRPLTCRTYDCRNDKRVWIDFDKRIPAPE
jgi:Fe-S-cluster containining protein